MAVYIKTLAGSRIDSRDHPQTKKGIRELDMHLLALLAGGNALALREKLIDENGPCFIRLVGRRSGLLDWFLTVIGINTTTVLEVYEDRIEYSYGSLSGRIQEMIPMSKVSNLVCAYFKPVILFFLAAIALIAGIVMACVMDGDERNLCLIPFCLSLIFFIYYWLKKTTVIEIIPNSAYASAALFKRSLIENRNISDEDAQRIINIIIALVERANRR